MNDKQQDRHLQTPSESNREKHINFLELEEQDNNTSNNNSKEEKTDTQKAWEELREENKNNTVENA